MRTRPAWWLLCAALVCTAFAGAALAEVEDETEAERFARVLFDPAAAAGDYDTYLENLIQIMAQRPDSHSALLALQRAEYLADEYATMRPLYEFLSGHVESNFAAFGTHAVYFAGSYIGVARDYAPDLGWQQVARRWRGLSDWHWIGPFTTGFDAAHDEVFPPEVLLDFSASHRGGHGDVSWRPVRMDDPLASRVELWAQERFAGAGYYIATVLTAPAEGEYRLHCNMPTNARVWLNGEYILDMDTRGGDVGHFDLPLSLRRGRNTLLVKVSGAASINLALHTMDGQPATDVIVRAPQPDDPRVPIRHGTPAHVQPDPDHARVLDALLRRADDEPREIGILLLALTSHARAIGLRRLEGELAELAAGLLADEPSAQLALVKVADRNPMFTGSESRRLQQGITAALLESNPAMIPAAIERARLLREEQQHRDAVALLRRVEDAGGASWRVCLKLARVYRDAEWRTEEYRELNRAYRMAPEAEPVLQALARYYGTQGILHRRVAIEHELLAQRPGDRGAHQGLIASLLRSGDADTALNHARQLAAANPGNSHVLRTLADTLASAGKLDEAAASFEQVAAMSPMPEDALVDAANMYLRHGRDEPAARLLRRALEHSPGKHFARRQLQRLLGESEDFWSEWAVGADAGMALDITAADFPTASSALVLDEMVQRVYADGSSVSFVRQVRRILTQDGVDEWGRERLRGELISARTIHPDGTVLEPITQLSGQIEYPGVEVGSYLEIAYLTRNDGNPFRTLDGDRWFFADPEHREPFGISRWVMLAPKDMPFEFAYFNIDFDDDGVNFETIEQGDEIVRVWDVRKPHLPEYEPFMPPALELIPWMECVVAHDWRERARRLAIEGLADTYTTRLIREQARELTNGVEDDIEKLRVLYDWVNARFITRGDAFNAHQALKAGAGDRRRVFVALAAAAGVELGFAFADAAPPFKSAEPEQPARPRWAYSRDSDFQRALFVGYGDNGPVFIDLEDRLRPFGVVSTRLHNAPVIIWHGGEYTLSQLPGGDPQADRFEHHAHVRLAADGSAEITGSQNLYGERSYGMKEWMRTLPPDRVRQMLESEVAGHFPGFELESADFPQLGDVGTPLLQHFKGRAGALAEVNDGELVLQMPGERLGRLLSALISGEQREVDLVLDFNLVQHDTMRISPPEGYAFAGVPRDLLFPTAPLAFSMQFRMDGTDLVITRRLALGPGRFRPTDYVDLVEQIKRIRATEATSLRLVAVD